MDKYKFRKYENKYVSYFDLEKEKLFKIIKPIDSNVKIEHVGSTAVLGLGGKGIVDVFVGLSKEVFEDKLDLVRDLLVKEGYEFRKQASYPERLFFREDYFEENSDVEMKGKRRVHVHLVECCKEEWNNVVRFRDILRNDKDILNHYVKIKKEAVEYAKGDGEKYREYKKGFIEKVIKKEKS